MTHDLGIPFDSVGAAMMRFAHRQEEVIIPRWETQAPAEYVQWDKQYEFADFDLEATGGPELLGVSTKPEFDYGEAL